MEVTPCFKSFFMAVILWTLETEIVLATTQRVRYALPAPDSGCEGNWVRLQLEVSYKNLTGMTKISDRFDVSLHVEGDDPNNILMRFCMWDSEKDDEFDIGGAIADDFGQGDSASFDALPDGTYCVYSVGEMEADFQNRRWDWHHGTCPKGFESGFSAFPFNTSFVIPEGFRSNPAPIQSPFSIFLINNTAVHYCCRQSGDVDVAIDLPFVIPFFLFPHKSTSCQKVKGMKHQLQYVIWPSMKYHGGPHPYINDSMHVNGGENVFYYCYYEPDTIGMEKSIIIATYTVMIGTPSLTFIVLCACRFTHRKLRKRKKQRQSLLAAACTTATSDAPVVVKTGSSSS